MPNRDHPEWKAEYEERLGMLCGQEAPTRAQEQIAIQSADERLAEIEIMEGLERIHELARERRRDWARQHGTRETRNPHND